MHIAPLMTSKELFKFDIHINLIPSRHAIKSYTFSEQNNSYYSIFIDTIHSWQCNSRLQQSGTGVIMIIDLYNALIQVSEKYV